jgi:predicted AAA+ superfamily ATPase
MERFVYKNLQEWKQKGVYRKPLLLQGARQVGKSYLLETFGREEFTACHSFNFEHHPELSTIFKQNLDPDRILDELSLAANKPIRPQSDLVIFDEIQECPKALNSLKYFQEKKSDLALCCAGSLLGITLSSESFPVGKVDLLSLHPLNFQEFLLATGEKMLVELLERARGGKSIPEIGHNRLWQLLKDYYVTGGMPEAVNRFIQLRDDRVTAFAEVRKLQQSLLVGYYKDVAKHAGKVNSMHIGSVFENIPMQLAANREASVKRYRFKGAVPGKKGFADLRGPITWLEKAGLILKVKVCKRAEIPLELFCKPNMFKLFLFDIGLLGTMLGLPPNILLQEDYGTAKGYFAENFVAQELTAAGVHPLYSWTERNSEIEFLRVHNDQIVPVEVKAGTRTQAKSMQQFIRKYSPEAAVIISARPPSQSSSGMIHYVPLYLAGSV